MYYPGLAASHAVPYVAPVYHNQVAHPVVAPVAHSYHPTAVKGESRVEYVPY